MTTENVWGSAYPEGGHTRRDACVPPHDESIQPHELRHPGNRPGPACYAHAIPELTYLHPAGCHPAAH